MVLIVTTHNMHICTHTHETWRTILIIFAGTWRWSSKCILGKHADNGMQRSSAMSPALAGKVTTRSISLWAFTLPDHLFRPVSTHFQLLYLVYYNMSVRFSSSSSASRGWSHCRGSFGLDCCATFVSTKLSCFDSSSATAELGKVPVWPQKVVGWGVPENWHLCPKSYSGNESVHCPIMFLRATVLLNMPVRFSSSSRGKVIALQRFSWPGLLCDLRLYKAVVASGASILPRWR